VLDVAQTEVKKHEKKHNHSLMHDPFTVGSMTIDETDVKDGKIPMIQGKKWVFRNLPASFGQQIHGGGGPIVRKNSTGTEMNRRRLNFIEGANITITLTDDPDDLETDVMIASSGGGGTTPIKEIPSGTVNGSNVTFTLSQTPADATELLFVNGILQNVGGGNDYTIVGKIITFATAPFSGDIIICRYAY